MQLNKERQRKIRNMLHKSLPQENSRELALLERNQQLSPLLRLPPELRNRIFELILDVGQINVCYKRWEHRSRTTKTGQRSHETVNGGFYCRILDKHQNPWRHPRDGVRPSPSSIPTTASSLPSPRPRRGMTLLSPVCRQLYHETALLPFRLNAWSFDSSHTMDRYILKEKRLPLAQRRAIRLLYAQTVLTSPVEKYFGGLEVIVLGTGLTMIRRVEEEGDPERGYRKVVAWDLSHTKWK
ncbi:uncharacterized protein C8A04DRAFT_29836 [Dichotomopilus funicola]|uniref:Uncharacterized protein n=1 Tax=Dichotomopilus funicola TaxID=1934379 RepID=A0AAN6V0Q5_9PEZI|nr:hypothetical protein C8A04DRAFT_29836 [Dichotomopilus funicola]